jgi:molybdate transport system regulatory protein
MIRTMNKSLDLRFRIDFDDCCSLGPGKIRLLEEIERGGSLSEAARTMKMSYRRAWLLLESLNGSFDRPVTVNSAGGRGGGGAALTDFGRRLVSRFRLLERRLNAESRRQLRELQRHLRGGTRQVAPRHSLSGRLSAERAAS